MMKQLFYFFIAVLILIAAIPTAVVSASPSDFELKCPKVGQIKHLGIVPQDTSIKLVKSTFICRYQIAGGAKIKLILHKGWYGIVAYDDGEKAAYAFQGPATLENVRLVELRYLKTADAFHISAVNNLTGDAFNYKFSIGRVYSGNVPLEKTDCYGSPEEVIRKIEGANADLSHWTQIPDDPLTQPYVYDSDERMLRTPSGGWMETDYGNGTSATSIWGKVSTKYARIWCTLTYGPHSTK